MSANLRRASRYAYVPCSSIRNVLLPHLLQHPELESELTRHWFSHTDEKGRVDLKHLNAQGHRSMAEMLISMSQRILCNELKKTNAGLQEEWKSSDKNIPGNEVLEYLPRVSDVNPFILFFIGIDMWTFYPASDVTTVR